MFAVANSALDLLVFQLRLDTVRVRLLLLAILLPRNTRPEDYVFTHTRRVKRGSHGVAFFKAKFGPGATLRHAWIDGFFDNGGPDAASGFHFLPFVVKTIRYHRFGAIFVGGNLLGGEGGGVIEFFIVSPVRAAMRVK